MFRNACGVSAQRVPEDESIVAVPPQSEERKESSGRFS